MAVDISEIARVLASQPRRRRPRQCQQCGKTAMGTRKMKYCSQKCADRASYLRQVADGRRVLTGPRPKKVTSAPEEAA